MSDIGQLPMFLPMQTDLTFPLRLYFVDLNGAGGGA